LGIGPINTRLTIRDENEKCFLCGPLEDYLLGNCVVTRLYNNSWLCFVCCAVRAEEMLEGRIPKLAAVGVQKSKRSTTESTRMRIESVIVRR
jgi:hypothetical protein